MEKGISIIIPAHNEENYIEQTLDSVLKLEHENKEIIVVCNGCSDKTFDKAKKYNNIKLLNMDEASVSKAKNLGVEHASNDNLLFLDADTTISNNALQEIINHTDTWTVGTFKILPDNKKFRAKSLMLLKNMVLKLRLYRTSNGTIFCNKEMFSHLGGFEEHLQKHEDGSFIRRGAKLGKFKFVTNAAATTSMRRFEKIGYSKVLAYWVKEWFKRHIGIKDNSYPVIR